MQNFEMYTKVIYNIHGVRCLDVKLLYCCVSGLSDACRARRRGMSAGHYSRRFESIANVCRRLELLMQSRQRHFTFYLR